MTYEQMRGLFARLAEAEGRFTVHLADSETRAGRAGAAAAWTVVVRDDARLPLPGAAVRALYRLTDAADLARLGVGDRPDGLCGLEEGDAGDGEERNTPAYRLTWRAVLGALDQLDARAPGWAVERIAATPARDPRYSLTVRAVTGATRLLPSRDAVDRLCLETGPLGAIRTGVGRGLPGVRGTAPYLGGRRAAPIMVWALRPARRPLPCTPGSLALDDSAGAACLWVDLCAPSADDLRTVARALGFPYDATLATLSPNGQPVAVRRGDCTALRVPVARRTPPDDDVEVEMFDLLVGRDALVTVHQRPLPAIERARAGDGLSRVAAASALADLVLAETLASEEALARWAAREADGWAARAPATPDPRALLPGALRCKRGAAALRRAAERRRGALAVAAAPRGDTTTGNASPLPAAGYLLAREARLVASLCATERVADGAVRLLVARATWRAWARRSALLRLTCVLGATAVAVLVRLALSGAHLAPLALGATTLVCFLIAGMGGAFAARVGRTGAGGGRVERQARAMWRGEDGDGDGAGGVG